MTRFRNVLKDQQGLTLVELLAVVVILGIIATIGAVGIGQVIQNSREDARVGDIQQAMSAAQMYDVQNGNQDIPTGVTAQTLIADGLLKNVDLEAPGNLTVVKEDGAVKLTATAGLAKAGDKTSKAFTVLEGNIGLLNRKWLFEDGGDVKP